MPWISSEAFLVRGNEMPLMTTEAFTNIGHACTASGSGHPKPFHKANYVASQDKVKCGGSKVIRQGDSTMCGDKVAAFSSKVKVGGKGVHRLNDATGGHACHFVANASAGGHPNVNAG